MRVAVFGGVLHHGRFFIVLHDYKDGREIGLGGNQDRYRLGQEQHATLTVNAEAGTHGYAHIGRLRSCHVQPLDHSHAMHSQQVKAHLVAVVVVRVGPGSFVYQEAAKRIDP